MIKVLIADDQALLRQSLGQLISIEENYEIVDLVSNGKEALDSCNRYHPDVVLMDIEMPVMDGLTALKKIKISFPQTKVIILTTFENKENIVEAFISDADGYMTKEIDPEELISIINCVYLGQTVIHKSVKKVMVDKFKKMYPSASNYKSLLSSEEIEIIKHIVEGKSNKDIGKLFSYTEGTIKNKVSRIYEKLGLSDRLQLTVCAIENGLD